MSRRKMPANGKANNGSTSLLYDNNNNQITDMNNNHLTNNNNSLLFNNNQTSPIDNELNDNFNNHSNSNSPNNIKKEQFNSSDLNDNSELNEDLNEEEQLNDIELEDDNVQSNQTSTPNTTALQQQLNNNKRTILNNKLTNGVNLQSSPLNMCLTNETANILNHLNNLTKTDSLIKNKIDGDSLLDNLTNFNKLNNLSFNNLNSLSQFNQLNSLTNLTQINQLNSLNQLNQFTQLNQQQDNDYDSVLINTNEEDEDSSNMVITPDIGDYSNYNDDDLDDQINSNLKSQLANTIDDDEEMENDLILNDLQSKDDREGCRSLICDSNGIIIAEMVYRCMVCSNISDSIVDAQRHYQLKHIFNQQINNLNNNNNFSTNNWKSNSANSSRSSNSSLQAQIRNKEIQQQQQQQQQFLKQKQKMQKLQQIQLQQQQQQQQQKIQQERFQQMQQLNKIKEQQKLKEQHKKNQRLLQMHLQQQHQNQLQIQQNQRLEQLKQQQKLNDEIAQMNSQLTSQIQSNNNSPQQLVQQPNVTNTVPDLTTLFANNPPLPGTVAKTPQNSQGGSSRGGFVTCAVCSITKFYASVQRRYGQFTCMGCAKFFGRFLAKPKKFNCPNLGSCALNTSPRCKACLLLACINTYTIDEKRKLVVNANRPVQRPGPSGPLIGRASDSAAKRKSAAAKA